MQPRCSLAFRKMVHYGWASAASWQMMRHASVETCCKRSRTQRCGSSNKKSQFIMLRFAFAAIWHAQSFLESSPTTTHVLKVNGSYLMPSFCANRSPFSQHCIFQCANFVLKTYEIGKLANSKSTKGKWNIGQFPLIDWPMPFFPLLSASPKLEHDYWHSI